MRTIKVIRLEIIIFALAFLVSAVLIITSLKTGNIDDFLIGCGCFGSSLSGIIGFKKILKEFSPVSG